MLQHVLALDIEHWQALRKHDRLIQGAEKPDQKKRRVDANIYQIQNVLIEHLPLLDQILRLLQSTSPLYP